MHSVVDNLRGVVTFPDTPTRLPQSMVELLHLFDYHQLEKYKEPLAMRRWPTKKALMVKKFLYLHEKIVQKAINPSFQREISMDRMRSRLVASARAHDQFRGGNNWSVAAYWKYLHNTDNSIRRRQSKHVVVH